MASGWQNPVVSIKAGIAVLSLAALLSAALFEVHFKLDMALPRDVELPDPAIEAEFDACYRARDSEIHSTAFGTIDNPDVQKEFINTRRADAVRECRALYPQKMITVSEPLRFDLVDLEPRFW